ncbi:hypothetical protein ABEB36_015754 [Hypothenemus hampei]|uniref:Uncharacterized protein n=1 Tax=Hypothenemus hampei TaxID=57062 RepID=A0ABD1DYX0_HYPHA
MDSQDEEKIYKILNHIKSNQNNLQNQLSMQYSVSNDLINNFNKSLENITHNEILLASRIIQLKTAVEINIKDIEVLHYKDLFNQLIILYNSVLYILQDIENSLMFCKLRTLHPSLQFAVKFENILDFESLIRLNCKIENMHIIYFLALPIDLEEDFELYHMLPIPTKLESEYRPVIPKTGYLLKSKSNKIRPLSDICTGTTVFQCPKHLLLTNDLLCEEEILLKGTSANCENSIVHIEQSYFPKGNQSPCNAKKSRKYENRRQSEEDKPAKEKETSQQVITLFSNSRVNSVDHQVAVREEESTCRQRNWEKDQNHDSDNTDQPQPGCSYAPDNNDSNEM